MIETIAKDVKSGLITGLVSVLISCAYAAFMFTGDLENYLPYGIGTLLISVIILRLIIAKFSDVPGLVAAPHSVVCLLVALMATKLSESLAEQHLQNQIFPTLIVLVFFSTVAVGFTFIIIGYFSLGRLMRYIPYSVVCGVLAGMGWSLLVRGSYIITNVPATLKNLPGFLEMSTLLQMGAAVLIALLLVLTVKAKIRPYLLTIALAAVVGVIYVVAPESWFIGPIHKGRLWPPEVRFSDLSLVNWSALIIQIPHIAAMIFTLIMAFLFNTATVEAFTGKDIQIDHELKVSGVANLATSLCGGLGGCQSSNQTVLNLQSGGNNYFSALVSSFVIAGILLFDASLLNILPKSLLAGIIIYFGISFLLEWGYLSKYKIPTLDYMLIFVILGTVGFFGFLPGVMIGITIAAAIFILNYSQINVIKYVQTGSSFHSNVDRSTYQQKLLQERGENICIVKLQGFIFFGTAYTFLEKIKNWIENTEHHKVKYLILDFTLVSKLDSSAILCFSKLRQFSKEKKFTIVFSSVNQKIIQQLVIGGYDFKKMDEFPFFSDIDYAEEWCEEQILNKEAIPSSHYILPDNIKELLNHFETVKCEKGHYLFHQGEKSDGIYFIMSGAVNVLLELPDGRKKRIRTIKEGTFVGELGFYLDLPRTTSVLIESAATLLFITKNRMNELKNEKPQLILSFYENIISMLAERVVTDNKMVEALLF